MASSKIPRSLILFFIQFNIDILSLSTPNLFYHEFIACVAFCCVTCWTNAFHCQECAS